MSSSRAKPSVPSERQLAHLRRSGGMSPEEAAAFQSAETDDAREQILRDIRARHAAARLAEAVAAGDVSAEEADIWVAQVRQGDHSSALRGRINRVARRASASRGNS